MPVQIGAQSPHFDDTTRLMSDCHRRIEMFLGSLQRVAATASGRLSDSEHAGLERALRYFREAAPKHTADEEESLFPRLRQNKSDEVRQAFGDMTRLEEDHRRADLLHAKIALLGARWLNNSELNPEDRRQFQDCVSQLAAIYKTHIEFEDHTLFPLADRILSTEEKAQVSREMAERRRQ